MVPPTLLRPLARLRWQERSLSLLWGLARALAVAAVFLAGCCLVDWLVDRFVLDETPPRLQPYLAPPYLTRFLFAGQVVIAALAVTFWVALPLLKRLSDRTVALWAETAWPAF